MPNNRFTYLRDIPQSCHYNAMIDCTKHGGSRPPNLPDCCTRCGWNPTEAEQRRARLEASINGK